MKRIFLLAAAFSVCSADIALAQPDATTDVDETTTADQQSPLAPGQAQTAPPRPLSITDLINGTAPYEPPAAQTNSAAEPPPVVVAAPASPQPVVEASSSPEVQQPVFLDDRSVTAGPPLTATDIAYETRVLGVFHSAQGRQGPLDGRWRVEAGARPLYTLQLSDPGAGEGRIEGAWRNLSAPGPSSSGFVEQVTRENGLVVVNFIDVADRRTELRLTPTSTGGWTGEAISGQDRASVTMVRDQGVEVAAFAVPAYTPPPPPPPPRAKAPPARKKVVAKKSRKPVAPKRASAKKK